MVAPVVVYPEEIQGVASSQPDPPSWVDRRKKRTQDKPYNLQLDYQRIQRWFSDLRQEHYPQAYDCDVYYPKGSPHAGHMVWSFGPYNGTVNEYQRARDFVTNKALGRFQKELADAASLGITLVQYRQALGMMTARLASMFKFASALKAHDFKGAWSHLRVTPEGYKRLVSKETKLKRLMKFYGNAFLEVHFGWEPLVKDIFQAMQVLEAPIPYGKVRASAKDVGKDVRVPPSVLNYWERLSSVHNYTFRCHIGANVEVTNPNLYLASSLGLTNPVDWLWDAIPYSFVVDWFIDVRSFLNNFNGYAGCTLTDSYHNFSLRSKCVNERSNKYPGYQGSSYVTTGGFSFERIAGLPVGVVTPKRLKLPSATRGLTASSLLAQFLNDADPRTYQRRFKIGIWR